MSFEAWKTRLGGPLRDPKTGETICPKCGRRYLWDLCLAKLRETIASERTNRAPCSYCQKVAS